jgi:hypothetical protein
VGDEIATLPTAFQFTLKTTRSAKSSHSKERCAEDEAITETDGAECAGRRANDGEWWRRAPNSNAADRFG